MPTRLPFLPGRSQYSPMRVRDAEKILKQSWEGLHHRRRIGLLGPAVTDHPQIGEILAGLNKLNAEIAISSLRIDALSDNVINELAKGKVQTITIAPEAGSQRLRDLVNKGINEEDIFVPRRPFGRAAFQPDKDVFYKRTPYRDGQRYRGNYPVGTGIQGKAGKKQSSTRITVNVSPFVPKPATPFQWLPMAPPEVLGTRMGILRSSLPLKGIKLNEESPAWSMVQAALSRGDEKLAPALADMKEISLAEWRRVTELHQIDINHYVHQKWDTNEKLPWSVIDSGMKEERLCGELEKAVGK